MDAQLSEHFDDMGLPADARDWLLDLWLAVQIIDDAQDGDKNDGAEDAAFAIFVRMPTNGFWIAKQSALLPVLAVMVIKWKAANRAELAGHADARSYMWRAGYYDVVAMVAHLCGCDPVRALGLYGETFAEYQREFP